MRLRPVNVSFLEEAGNTLSYRHSIFHSINRPQPGCGLKYFMRLGVIGFGYRGEGLRHCLRTFQAKHRAAAI